MKTLSKHIFLIIIFASLFQSQVYSQTKRHSPGDDDPNGVIEAQVISAVQAKFGSEYTAGISVLDSMIAWNESTHDGGELTDPYGTLKGCILFSIWKIEDDDEEHGIMGIFKNGQILWYSNPIFKDGWRGIYAIKDINRDGKVEILVDWTPGDQLIMVSHLWIISWDGSIGTIINQTSPINGNTMIHAEESIYDLFEIDTSSAMMIRSRWPGPDEEDFSEYFPNNQIQTYPFVTYSWNGSQYGVWPNTRQIPGDEFLSANHLTVTVNCVVNNIQDSLSFQYYWSNSPKSEQRMSNFSLGGVQKSFLPLNLTNWFFIGWMRDYPVAGWMVFAPFEYNVSLQPGKSQVGILLHTQALPGIVNYYAQGFRSPPDFGVSNPNYKSSAENDLFNNSYIGNTIGPVDPPNPFAPLNFLDSLTSFTTRSRQLDWIKQQPISDKYTGYFSTAKTALQKNQISLTRTTLTQVLHDVDVDSSSTLTSEAYALIKYNTEYLLAHLPITISALDMLDTLRVRTDRTIPNNTPCGRDFKEDLLENIKKAKQELIEGDTIHCAMYIVAYEKQLEAKNNHRKGKPCVTDDEYNYLYPYAKSIVELLLQLPPKCGGSCKDKLIDLKAEVGKCAGKGYCSRGEFENGMEEQIGKAVKCIENKDSTGTATCLGLFEQEVQQTYEQTKKRYDERKYVKPEGYITLYYKAEYILEDLEH